MTLTKSDRAKQALATTMGFWSALLVAAITLWFYLAFIPYRPLWNAPWPGIAAYAAAFQPAPFLAWVVPSFALAPVVLIMLTCVHAWAEPEQQLWSLLAVVFAGVYAAVLIPFYYMQMTVVPHHLLRGTMDGLALWLFAYDYPYNLFGAVEATGYGLLSVSFLCAAQVFGSGTLQRWVRWTFVGEGLAFLGLFVNPLFPLPPVVGLIDGLVGLVLGVLAPLLLALLFQRSKHRPVAVAPA